MRLSTDTQKIIHDTAQEIFGSKATVTVFGSRIDDSARGGDIDLLIQSETPIAQGQRKILQFVARLQIRLGDQSFDVLLLDPNTNRQAVHKEALNTGVVL